MRQKNELPSFVDDVALKGQFQKTKISECLPPLSVEESRGISKQASYLLLGVHNEELFWKRMSMNGGYAMWKRR